MNRYVSRPNFLWFQAAVIAVFGLIAYANSFQVPVQFDDHAVLGAAFDNVSGGVTRLFSPAGARFVTDLTFALNRWLHGYWVPGFHLVNLSIHIGAALALFAAVRSLLGLPDKGDALTDAGLFIGRFIPFAAALLFVCHPIQTQAVTYISQRYTSMSALCYLLSLFAFLKARQATPTTRWWWSGCILLALMAMKSKQTAITLPFMLALVEVLFYQGRLLKRPLFIVMLLALLAVIPAQQFSGTTAETAAQGISRATAETAEVSRYDYFLTEQQVMATYLRLLVLPINQNLDYDYPIAKSFTSPPVMMATGLHLALLLLAVALIRRSRTKSGADAILQRLAALGIFWFYLTLAVESTFIPIRDVIFEHRLYLPSGGMFILFAVMLGWLTGNRLRLQPVAWGMVMILGVALVVGTIQRNRVWGSELLMWQDVLAKSPNKARARFNAGVHYGKHNLPDLAIINFVKAIELEPDQDIYRMCLNSAVNALDEFRDRSSSGIEYQSTQESVNPAHLQSWLAVSYNNLGLAYDYLGDLVLSRKYYEKAVAADANFALAWYNLALFGQRTGDTLLANHMIDRLRRLNPGLADLASQQQR